MNFKHHALLGLAITAALGSGQALAQAAPSAKLSVTGSFVPTACVPTLSESSIDYGVVGAAALNKSTPTSLGSKSVTLTITCKVPGAVGVRIADSRAGTAAPGVTGVIDSRTGDAHGFGLGVIADPAGDQPIGAYTVRITDVSSTSGPKFLMWSADNGSTWGDFVASALFAPGQDQLLGWTGTAGFGPGAYDVSTMKVNVLAGIAPTDNLTLDSEVELDGEAVIELVYI